METIELLAIIQKRAMEAGSQKALALEMRISPGYLSEVRPQAQGDAYGSLPDG